MKSFDYVRPATVREAVTAAAAPGAAYLAAGTNLLDLMKGGVTAPNRLVDITHLSGLDRIEELPDGGLRIGALIRNADQSCRGSMPRFGSVAIHPWRLSKPVESGKPCSIVAHRATLAGDTAI
jgi:CO/xanthine dehydrogenase FAD-binding subunit